VFNSLADTFPLGVPYPGLALPLRTTSLLTALANVPKSEAAIKSPVALFGYAPSVLAGGTHSGAGRLTLLGSTGSIGLVDELFESGPPLF
jgi:hypothetical protein